MKKDWWKHAVIYHIYPRSFYDSNNDGIGDLKGIEEKLPYLKDLGIDAIWLSPVYKSPQVDFGYDVSDFRAIDPIFGDLNDFKSLLAAAHQVNIKIIMDMILNHTSDQHPWFKESRSSKDNSKRDWYIWKKAKNKRFPNNWKTAFGKSAWEFDKATQEFYYHSFFKEQPDLNWRNSEVKKAMFSEIKFWLDLGIDGIRLDVINMIAKDKKFRDNPMLIRQLTHRSALYTRNRPRAIKIIKSLRKLLDKYEGVMSVGEIYTLPPGDSKLAASYLGNGTDSLHMAFDFSLIFTSWNPKQYAKTLSKSLGYIPKKGWPCHVLSNHDLNRSISKPLIKSRRVPIAKLKAVMLFTLRGTSFVYYGEEIGMENTKIAKKSIQDPMGKLLWPFYTGRDKARTPMQWSSKTNAGFSKNNPWLPIHKSFYINNVEYQTKSKDSIWWLYKNLIEIRKNSNLLKNGNWSLIPSKNKNILAYKRSIDVNELVIIINFKPSYQLTNIITEFDIVFSTHRNSLIESNILYDFEGVIIKPERSVYSV